jgi:predicted transcriptional regulator
MGTKQELTCKKQRGCLFEIGRGRSGFALLRMEPNAKYNVAALYLSPVTEDIMDTLTLSQADTRRLEKLAHAAGRTPKDVLRHVLRDGFEATEYAVKAVKARMQGAERVSHEDAMQQLDDLIERHVRDEKQAA